MMPLSLQVADNGKGVPPEDHAALALKYHTSKISQFQDLEVGLATARQSTDWNSTSVG